MIRNKQSRLFRKLPLVAAIGMASLASMAVQQASAHGYIESPKSRAYMCRTNVNADCGGVTYEPQSVEYTPFVEHHFPDAASMCKEEFSRCGPADGRIASGGMERFKTIDEVRRDWAKTDVKPGVNVFTWKYEARHPVKYKEFYITKNGWDSTKPLTRDSFDLEPILHVDGNNQMPSDRASYEVNIPADHTGYHVVLATWRVGDTDATFYQAIDLNIDGEEVAPSPWTTLGAVLPKALEIGDKITTRVFDATGERVDKQVSLTIASDEQAKADIWPHMLAQKVNAANFGYLMGELNTDGEVVPNFGKNTVFVKKGSDIESFQLGQELVNQPIELSITGMQPSYTLKDGNVDLHFNAIADGSDVTINAKVVNAKNESIAYQEAAAGNNSPHFSFNLKDIEAGKFSLEVNAAPKKGSPTQKVVNFTVQAESDGSYDFVFPEGLKEYKAGTTVLQPKDGNTYECKPGQVAGWCIQWSPTATGFEPGVGSNWQDAWIRK